MKTQVYFSDFCKAFQDHDREDQFSYKAKRVLFDHLEQYEEETGEVIELDVIALCCDFVEMNVEDVHLAYTTDRNGDEDDEELMEKAIAFLEHHTTVCGTTGTNKTIVFANF